VLVGESGLLRDALGGQQIAKPLAGRRLARKLGDLDEALLGEPLDIEVGEPERHPEPPRQIALGQGPAFTDRGEDLEVALDVAIHRGLDRSRFEHTVRRPVKENTATREGRRPARSSPYKSTPCPLATGLASPGSGGEVTSDASRR
jgi:hypothetical protein